MTLPNILLASAHAKFLPVDDYVEKGIEPEVLLEKIEQQLTKKAGDK